MLYVVDSGNHLAYTENRGHFSIPLRLCDFALNWRTRMQRREGAKSQRLETTESIRISNF